MQVDLNLDVERMLPDFIRRRFIVKQETLYPNRKRGILSKILHDDNTLSKITKGVIVADSNQVFRLIVCSI
jgi:hypothetical protein